MKGPKPSVTLQQVGHAGGHLQVRPAADIFSTQLETTGLMHYDRWVKELAICHKVDEVKEIHAKARAIEVYAKQAQNLQAERLAAEIRIRAERRCGQLMRGLERGKGVQEKAGPGRGKKKKTMHHDGARFSRPESEYAKAKATANISRKQAQTWQELPFRRRNLKRHCVIRC
jgi:hypothetical protein